MLSKIKFEEEWDEICPIFRKVNNYKSFEQIGTGVLVDIWGDVYLFTASHVIDFIYENNDEMVIPTEYGFHRIEGELFHNPLIYGDKVKNPNEYRKSDNIDFSYYKLSKNFISKLCKNYKPLQENKIDTSSDFSLDYPIKNTRTSQVKKKIKEAREKEFTDEEIDLMDDYKITITIIFAGYPLNKSKYKSSQFSSEIVYYHGRALNKDSYISGNYDMSINILAQYGKYGSMNSDFTFENSPKAKGISGGGVYKIIRTENGFDRKLIGIAHQQNEKEHLFIGTNISHCLNLIKNNQIMPYEVHQRLNSMCEALWQMDKFKLLKDEHHG